MATVLIIIIISLFILSTLALIWARARRGEKATIIWVVTTVVVHVTFWVAYPDISRNIFALMYETVTIVTILFFLGELLDDRS